MPSCAAARQRTTLMHLNRRKDVRLDGQDPALVREMAALAAAQLAELAAGGVLDGRDVMAHRCGARGRRLALGLGLSAYLVRCVWWSFSTCCVPFPAVRPISRAERMRASLRQAGAGRCGGSTGWLRHSGVASAPSERRIGLQHQDLGDNETGSLRLEVFASASDCATSDCASLSHGHAWGMHGAGGLGWTSGRAARGSRGFSGCSARICSRRGSARGCLGSRTVF